MSFANGDKFIGNYKDGRPNGYGELSYKNSLLCLTPGVEFEVGQYRGEFRLGKREGQGKMVWADGSSFTGTWKGDERLNGKMIMANGCVYVGSFKNDKFHGPNE